MNVRPVIGFALLFLLLAFVSTTLLGLSHRQATRYRAEAAVLRKEKEDALRYADIARNEQFYWQDRYNSAMVEYQALVDSIEQHANTSQHNEDRIRNAPADSLPVIIRRLIADARKRGYIE